MTFYYCLLKIKDRGVYLLSQYPNDSTKEKNMFPIFVHFAKSFRRIRADLLHCLYKISPCEFWIAIPILLFFTNPRKYFAWKYFIQSLSSFSDSDRSLYVKHCALCWLCRLLRCSLFLKELRRPWGKQMGTQTITIPWYKYFDKDLELAHIAHCMAQWENLKPLLTVRMCSGRQATEEPCLAVVSRVNVLSKRGQSSQISHSHSVGKNVCIFPRAEFRIQRPQFGRSQAESQTMPGRKSETSHYQNQGSYWEFNIAGEPSRKLPCALFFTAVASSAGIGRHIELPPEDVNEGITWLKSWFSSLIQKEKTTTTCR